MLVEPVVTGRFKAETIPLVTVPDKPSGEPKATTASPIAIEVESPLGISGRFPFLIETIAIIISSYEYIKDKPSQTNNHKKYQKNVLRFFV